MIWLLEKEFIPKSWGLLHLAAIVMVVIFSFVFFVTRKERSDKTNRILLGIMTLFMWVGEIIYVLQFTFCLNTIGEFKWNTVSYQFCSLPLYVLPFIVFLKDSKFRDSLIVFVSTFTLFAGISVLAYPDGLWCPLWVVDIQTIIHHSAMIFIPVFLITSYRDKITLRNLFRSFGVFTFFACVALVLNLVLPIIFDDCPGMNLFYISPRYNSSLPVLSMIQPLVPYPVFFITYILGFCFVAFIMYFLIRCVMLIYTKDKFKNIFALKEK